MSRGHLNYADKIRALTLLDEGVSVIKIAEQLNVGRVTVYKLKMLLS